MKQIGFILWDGETVRTGHDNAIKVYAKEEMARRISIAMGIPYRAVFIDEGGAPVEKFEAPVETPKGKIDARGCRDRWNQAVRALENPRGAETTKAVMHVLQILDDVITAAEETQ